MEYEKLLSKIRCGVVEDKDIESYLQGLEFEKWKEDKDLEATEEVITGQDEDGNDIVETRLVNVYEPIDVSEQIINWKLGNYQILRQPLYPNMTEYADAVVKDDVEAQERYIAKCLDIKARYPKGLQ